MKDEYKIEVPLRCVVCAETDFFEFNEDKSYCKCTNCGKEYSGGYDELVSYNQEAINNAIKEKRDEIEQDLSKDIHNMLKDAFRGNKYIKFK